jgi:hypothetical protein
VVAFHISSDFGTFSPNLSRTLPLAVTIFVAIFGPGEPLPSEGNLQLCGRRSIELNPFALNAGIGGVLAM